LDSRRYRVAGYDPLIPSGQKPLTPVRKIQATPLWKLFLDVNPLTRKDTYLMWSRKGWTSCQGGFSSRRDRTKVARYEVPGKAAVGEPSQRVRSDGYVSGFTIWRREDVDPKKIRAEEGGTPPSGQPIIPFPTGRNLFFVATRHFVPGYHHSVPSGRVWVRARARANSAFRDAGELRRRLIAPSTR
jgi:hypothetical protein